MSAPSRRRKLSLHFHFSDADEEKTRTLESYLRPLVDSLPNTSLHVRSLPFEEAFKLAIPILYDSNTANLVLIDPCGVNHVDDEIFRKLIGAPTTDFLLFVASSYLHRFGDHPAMKLRIKKSDSFYHCHRAVVDLHCRRTSLLPCTVFHQKGERGKGSKGKGSAIYY